MEAEKACTLLLSFLDNACPQSLGQNPAEHWGSSEGHQCAWRLLPSAEGEAKAAVRLFLDEITDPNAQQLPLWLAEMCAHLLWGFVPVVKEFCQLQEDSGFLPN